MVVTFLYRAGGALLDYYVSQKGSRPDFLLMPLLSGLESIHRHFQIGQYSILHPVIAFLSISIFYMR